jgi:hypothetical protein
MDRHAEHDDRGAMADEQSRPLREEQFEDVHARRRRQNAFSRTRDEARLRASIIDLMLVRLRRSRKAESTTAATASVAKPRPQHARATA